MGPGEGSSRDRRSVRTGGIWRCLRVQLIMATSTWLPLLVAALGIVGTVGGTVTGVVLTQRQASRRDAITWARERERERERWAREDADRTFSNRRDTYVDFYESLRDMAFLVYNFGMGLVEEPDGDDGRLPFDFQLPTFRKLQHLRIYATPLTFGSVQGERVVAGARLVPAVVAGPGPVRAPGAVLDGLPAGPHHDPSGADMAADERARGGAVRTRPNGPSSRSAGGGAGGPDRSAS